MWHVSDLHVNRSPFCWLTFEMAACLAPYSALLLIIYKSQQYGSEVLMRWHPPALAPLPPAAAPGLSEGFKSVPSADTCHGLSCQRGSSHWFSVAVKWIKFFFPVSRNKFTRVMIGVWAGYSPRTLLFISNGQQFAHLSTHGSAYTNITLLLAISPHYYSPQHHSILTSGSLHFLSLPLSLPLPPLSFFFSKWYHQSLLRPLPRLITQSAAGCSWMHLYGLAARARGQAGGYICHDSNALTQRSVLNAVAWTGPRGAWTRIQTCAHTQEIKSADRRACACINKCTMKLCLDRCPETPECWRIYTNIYRESQPCTGTPPVPPLSPLMFT